MSYMTAESMRLFWKGERRGRQGVPAGTEGKAGRVSWETLGTNTVPHSAAIRGCMALGYSIS